MTTDRNLSTVSNSERAASPEVRCVQHANAPAEGSDGSHSVTRPLAALALPRQPGSQAGPRGGGRSLSRAQFSVCRCWLRGCQ